MCTASVKVSFIAKSDASSWDHNTRFGRLLCQPFLGSRHLDFPQQCLHDRERPGLAAEGAQISDAAVAVAVAVAAAAASVG